MNARTMNEEVSLELCETECPSTERVALLKETISDDDMIGMAEIFKALADPTRVKVAYMLDRGGELCVCDVAEVLGSSTATASHHLRTLKNKDIAKSRKAGKNVYYSLKDDHIRTLLHMTLEHQKEKM
ncbi:metalloregulator ArsR/SmtB family transcription factor [Paenibacillus sp. FSL W8-0187]|jgi:ArsR family transcriptional regulator, lead/cadmium/zinc/bismuth-responsive transcriptional repressor|uniref:Transcriptional regulator n=1 Tax=Paenibacillus lautus TaxID=1401 RepID=A0A1R1AN64_PAELA|nr:MULTISPECIES: metalloregulator ArsR/SmtB family transcription factor [Paenibacillus]OME87015.1 transcriptional regulator [Paenibacillus lautus]GIP01554.1 transcriptional regulator [Paenibacillus lautus]